MKTLLTVIALLLLASPGMAEPEPRHVTSGRYEVWLGMTRWPAMSDVQPLAAGEFDEVGFGLGGAFHGPLKQFENSELLVGVDAFVGGTVSNVRGVIDDLIARDLYLGASLKWALGATRGLQLDAGLGFHLVDMAQVSARYLGLEYETWESTRVGAFVGATWDVWAGRENRSSGLSLAFKVHYVDLGTVRDEDILLVPLLGPNAGKLDGPLYVLQIGYSGR